MSPGTTSNTDPGCIGKKSKLVRSLGVIGLALGQQAQARATCQGFRVMRTMHLNVCHWGYCHVLLR